MSNDVQAYAKPVGTDVEVLGTVFQVFAIRMSNDVQAFSKSVTTDVEASSEIRKPNRGGLFQI
jgi:hypothetical protein